MIDAALARLDAADPVAATDARAALDWLLDGQGLDVLSQFAVQQFCWYDLPFKWLVAAPVRAEIVEALARFLELAGLARYAEVCRSDTTARLSATWDADPTAGFRAWRRAAEASGVEPPPVDGWAWGDLMGPVELAAFRSTAQALELAVAAGELRPGARGWRQVQQDVARAHLTHPRVERFGQPPLLDAVTERLGHWVEVGGPAAMSSRARTQILAPVANRLLQPVPVPRTAHRAVAPLAWLVDRVPGAGLRLTATGALPPALARAAVAAHPGWGTGRVPRRADDAPGLLVVEAVARRSGLVARRGGRLVARGADPAPVGRARTEALWGALTAHPVDGDDLAAAARELLLAVSVADDGMGRDDAVAEVVVALTETGWHRGLTGEPVPVGVVRGELDRLVEEGRVLGLLREEGPRARRRLRLTATGRPAAEAALRARALRPARPGR